jgi:polyisoprenoid-binding protein YceI
MRISSVFKVLVVAGGLLIGGLSSAYAQSEVSTQITYKVPFGPIFPIEGSSSQLTGQISLNDTTGVLEKLEFDVPLTSFVGQNAGYLAWVGNAWVYPDMRFHSNSISQKADGYTVRGSLEFRGRSLPLNIRFVRTEKDGETILTGEFNLSARDYFTIPPSIDLVPNRIPVRVTMVFNQPVS